jgi:hypothetical protein
MKKSARTILSLVLTLVLICALAITALAHDRHTFEDEFNGGTIIEYAYINMTRLYGDITVEDESGMHDSYIRQVTMELWYIAENDDGHPTTYKWPTTISATGSGPNVSASKAITSTTVYGRKFVCLSYANYSCEADVVSSYTVQRYSHGPGYFSYLML